MHFHDLNQAARSRDDLQWVLHSESLVAGDGDCWPDAAWFRSLQPGETVAGATPASRRLGLQFEQMIQDWLLGDPDRQLLAHNLQVRTDGRTLGEFDLLVQTPDGPEHWELAVKFFLGTGDQRDARNWYGPNPDDTLAGKLERLQGHQLMLSRTAAGMQLLAAMQIHDVRPRGFVKGRLFYPYEQFQAQRFVHPEIVNPRHARGWWQSIDDFLGHTDAGRQFVLLDKSLWLAPLEPQHACQGCTLDELMALIDGSANRNTWHVAIIDDDGTEQSRGFLVSARWLAATRQRDAR